MSKRNPLRYDHRLGLPTGRDLRKRLGLNQNVFKTSEWHAEVREVKRCYSTFYNGGHGFITDWEYTPDEPNRRCFLIGDGDLRQISLTLKVNAVHKDPNPDVLHQFSIPTEGGQISLRLFDKGMYMELHIDPDRQDNEQPIGTYWAFTFRAHNEPEMKLARAMLRRLEFMTREMPDVWFKYRNYYTVPGAINRDQDNVELERPAEPQEGYFRMELSGGHSMEFTNHLATTPFLRAFGYQDVRPARPQEDPVGPLQHPRLTRSMVLASPAYAFSSLTPSNAVSIKVIKKGKLSKKLSKLETRRAQRALAGTVYGKHVESEVPSESSEGVLCFAAVVIPPPGAENAAIQSSASQAADPSATQVADEGTEAASAGSDVEYPIKEILDEDVNSDGETMYLMDWEGDFEATWQPEGNISNEALLAWKAKKRPTRKRPAKQRGRPRKRGRKS